MSWIGAGIGALFGAQRGVLGSVIGAVIGNWVEEKVKGLKKSGSAQGREQSANRDELATLGALAAMLSKLAKADGRITEDEVRYCEQVFDRLGLRGEKREYCIRVFRAAKNDGHSIYDYAASFASALCRRTSERAVWVYERPKPKGYSQGTFSLSSFL